MDLTGKLRGEYANRLEAVKTDRYALATTVICVFLLALIIYGFSTLAE